MREAALNLLRIMHQRRMQYDSVNAGIKRLQPDFPSLVTMIDIDIEREAVRLLDVVLGDEIASYFLYVINMKDGGSITELDGVEWPIKSVEDVEAYVTRPRS